MIVVVGQLVQHQLALYGNYIFTGTLLFSSVLMGKIYIGIFNPLSTTYCSLCTAQVKTSHNRT